MTHTDAEWSDELNALYRSVKTQNPSVVIAGHYCLAAHMNELSHHGNAEADSFALGCGLTASAHAHSTRSQLVLWINDIGIDPSLRPQLRESYELPENYREILYRARLTDDDLTVIFESTIRNKASTLLRRLYKHRPYLFRKVGANTSGLVRCVGAAPCGIDTDAIQHAYVVNGPDGEPLVVKDGSNPKCNLILATFFEELRARFSPALFINIFNDVYQYRVGLGIHVSRYLFDNSTPFVNVFCDGFNTTPRVERSECQGLFQRRSIT